MSIILGTEVDNINTKLALKKIDGFLTDSRQHYIVTPNPEIALYATQEKNSDYRRFILNKADLKIPDGFGLLLASWLLGCPLWRRVCGTDLMVEICYLATKKGERIFLFGAMPGVVEECRQKLTEQFPGIKIVGIMDGYEERIKNQKFHPPEFSPKIQSGKKIKNINQNLEFDNQQLVIFQINQSRPDILFVALGSPAQEKFIAENLKNMPSIKLAMGVGGAFDFIAGRVKRAPRFIRQLGIEWLWRLIIEPWRAKRIYNATIKFLLTVVVWRLRMIFALRLNVVVVIIKHQVLPEGKFSDGGHRKRGFQVLIVKRKDLSEEHWQLPQGGIDKSETAEQALKREIEEELGLTADFFKIKIKIIKKIKNFYHYIWPKDYRLFQGFRGQKQTLFVLDWLGDNSAFKLDQKEIVGFKWVNLEDLVASMHEVRREQAEKVLEVLKSF